MRDSTRSFLQQQVRSLTPAPLHPGRPLWQRYGVALLVWLCAAVLTLRLAEFIGRSQFLFFWVAILFAAWFSGFVPALLAAVGAVFAVNYYFLAPVRALAWPVLPDVMMLVVFMIVASAVSALTVRLAEEERGAQARARELTRMNEQLVQQQAEISARAEASQMLLREVEAANAGLAVVNAALEESEQRWQTLADIAPVFIWTSDHDGSLTWVNRPWLDFTGRSLADELGHGWLATLHPDDASRVHASFADALAGRRAFDTEYRQRGREGGYRWYTSRGVPRYDDARAFIGYIGSCIDITERRVAEERSRALQHVGATLTSAARSADVATTLVRDAAPAIGAVDAGLLLLDAEGALARVDSTAEASVAESERSEVREVTGARPSSPWDALALECVRTRRTTVACPVVWEEAPGRTDASRACAVLPLMLDAECAGALAFALPAGRELDDEEMAYLATVAHVCAQALGRVRLFEAERHARREADAANRAKSDFLAQLSHELRTPLNAVGGYADLIAMGIHGPITDAQQSALSRLKRAQQELLTHIDELLTFARIDRPTRRYAFAPVPVGPVLREVESMIAPQAGGKGLTLVVEPGSPGLCAWGDRDRVRQILLNLAANAVKYTPTGGRIVLAARACTQSAAERRIDFEISDSGRGIPAEKLESIFDPFVQLSRKPFEPREGVGLGLAISRRLATDMDGELTVRSQVGVGSSFRLSLREATSAAGQVGVAGTAGLRA